MSPSTTAVSVISLTLVATVPSAAAGAAGNETVLAAVASGIAQRLGVNTTWVNASLVPSMRRAAAVATVANAPLVLPRSLQVSVVSWLVLVRPPSPAAAMTFADTLTTAIAAIAAAPPASLTSSLASAFTAMAAAASLLSTDLTSFSVTGVSVVDSALPTPAPSPSAGVVSAPGTFPLSSTSIAILAGVLGGAAIFAITIVGVTAAYLFSRHSVEKAAAAPLPPEMRAFASDTEAATALPITVAEKQSVVRSKSTQDLTSRESVLSPPMIGVEVAAASARQPVSILPNAADLSASGATALPAVPVAPKTPAARVRTLNIGPPLTAIPVTPVPVARRLSRTLTP